MSTTQSELKCNGVRECAQPVTHIDHTGAATPHMKPSFPRPRRGFGYPTEWKQPFKERLRKMRTWQELFSMVDQSVGDGIAPDSVPILRSVGRYRTVEGSEVVISVVGRRAYGYIIGGLHTLWDLQGKCLRLPRTPEWDLLFAADEITHIDLS